MLTCSNSDCQEVVSFGGTGSPQHFGFYDERTEEYDEGITDAFRVNFFLPPLHLFQINIHCPEDIREEILSAFSLYWSDASSCANKIRVALELIMNQQGIRKILINKKKERIKLSLHKRLELFSEKLPEIANYLMAIKWIGNSGSHTGELTKEDLLDAFQLLEYSIEKLYDNKTKLLAKLSREIVKKKGPRSKGGKTPF